MNVAEHGLRVEPQVIGFGDIGLLGWRTAEVDGGGDVATITNFQHDKTIPRYRLTMVLNSTEKFY